MKKFITLLAVVMSAAGIIDLAAQTAPTAPTASSNALPAIAEKDKEEEKKGKEEDDVVVLNPFVVDSSKDQGYRAENTLAGSRLNTKLSDTASSVSVFTQQFQDDLGINTIDQLVQYTVGTSMNVQDTGSTSNANALLNGSTLEQGIDIRGLPGSVAIDYFKNITPNDNYRTDRYDESRGPNGILFGISQAGGLINQNTILATTTKDSGRVRYEVGSGATDANRLAVRLNEVIIRKKLGLAIAAVHQENSNWRKPSYDDKDRLFGALTLTPTDRVTIRINGERGRELTSKIPPSVMCDAVLAWLDNRNAGKTVTFGPANFTAPQAAAAAKVGVGVTGRIGNNSNRFIYVQNNDTFRTTNNNLTTTSYGYSVTESPTGERGQQTGTATYIARINDPSFLPYDINSAGTGMYRETRFHNHTANLDWRITDRLNFSFSHNRQSINLDNPYLAGEQPMLSADPNQQIRAQTGVTAGGVLNTPATASVNPYVGQLYIDAAWRRDLHEATFAESRFSLSYDLDTRWKWFGSHRLAVLASQSKDTDRYNARKLGFIGAPWDTDPLNSRNLLTQRTYVDENNPYSFVSADWRSLPSTVQLGAGLTAVTKEIGWINGARGVDNSFAIQDSAARLAVVQSQFFNNHFITTLGYRTDTADFTSYGFKQDPVLKSDVLDYDLNNPELTRSSVKGISRSAGVVWHVNTTLDLVANWSTNIGIPNLRAKVLPYGLTPEPSHGEGVDYGFAVNLLDGKLSMKAVYFETTSRGQVGTGGIDTKFNDRNVAIAGALRTALVGTASYPTSASFAPVYKELTIPVNGRLFDQDSDGVEFSLLATPTRNINIKATYSYTDRIRSNTGSADIIPWYGFILDDKKLVETIVKESGGVYDYKNNNYTPDGIVARWIQLAKQITPTTTLDKVITGTSDGGNAALDLKNIIDDFNDDKYEDEQRWGLRPHKASVFGTYEFSDGRLRGFAVGAGGRYRSASIIGQDSTGKEISGRELFALDLMLRYTQKIKRWGISGRMRYQINISNVTNYDGVLPTRYTTIGQDPYTVPGGRGLAYGRFDLLEPRTINFTADFSF